MSRRRWHELIAWLTCLPQPSYKWKYIGRVLNNLVDKHKILHIDALSLHHKYSDVFDMEDVPEAERIETARQVVDQIRPMLSGIRGIGTE